MAKKKTEVDNSAPRVAEYRKRLIEKQIAYLQVKLPEKTIRKLDRLCSKQNLSRDTVLDDLINSA